DHITSMANAIDQMQKTAKAVMLFNIRSFTPQMKEMGDAIVKCAVLVEEAVPLLRSISKEAGRISSLTEQITQIEGRADDLHDVGLKELFETHGATNPMAFITGNEVYDHLENVRDRSNAVANELQSVGIDHVGPGRTAKMKPAALGLPLLVALVAIALVFDFFNGMNDAGNSIATIVSTRVLKPQYAVIWASFFNFIAFIFFGLHVAQTIGTGIIDVDIVTPRVIFGALVGAIAWDVITWSVGIPASSSHALIGGLIGAGIAKAGFGAVVWSGVGLTSFAIVLSPLIGFSLALLLMFLVSWLCVRTTPYTVDRN